MRRSYASGPKLAPHISAMRKNIADAFGLPLDAVSVKLPQNISAFASESWALRPLSL